MAIFCGFCIAYYVALSVFGHYTADLGTIPTVGNNLAEKSRTIRQVRSSSLSLSRQSVGRHHSLTLISSQAHTHAILTKQELTERQTFLDFRL